LISIQFRRVVIKELRIFRIKTSNAVYVIKKSLKLHGTSVWGVEGNRLRKDTLTFVKLASKNL
jgi:hypothetical protein